MLRRCLDCGTLTPTTRCPVHTRAKARMREVGRLSAPQRGYGADHRAARARLATTLPDLCGYCEAMVYPSRWVAAHVVDGDPSAGWMVAHPACNERAKVRRVR